jgi:23S rRNA (guanosine2251-2'-O)-methyltransferase
MVRNHRPTNNRRQAHRAGQPGGRPDKRHPANDAGHFWLYGFHPVLAALNNPQRQCRRLLWSADGAEQLRSQAAALPEIRASLLAAAETTTRHEIERLVGGEPVHQGLALEVLPLNPASLEATIANRVGPVLLLDQVTDPHNVGAILRSATAFGAAAVILQERHSPPESGALAKAASGALEHVPVLREVNLTRALEKLKDHDFWCVGLDSNATIELQAARAPGHRTALVLGAEGAGLRRLVSEACDVLARIPLAGNFMPSLNVSNAAAIGLYEITRRA